MEQVQPAPVAPAAPAAAVEVPAVPVGDTAAPEPKPDRTFTQAELDDILEKRLSKERRKREDIQRRLQVTEELALRKRDDPPKPAPVVSGEPKRESFDSYEAFIEARAEWKADQKVEERFRKQSEEQQTRTATENQQKQAQEFKKRTKELAKGLENFDEVMAEATSSPDSPVSRLFAEPIQECDNPAAVLFHLATNPEEAERIADLVGHKQAREIWALDAKLKSAPAPKKPSSAPEPIKPVGGKAATGDDEPPASNTKAWIDWRNRQIQAKRKGT